MERLKQWWRDGREARAWLDQWRRTEQAADVWLMPREDRARLFRAFLVHPREALRFRDAIEEGRAVRAAYWKAITP
jgi:hypothetical protein